MHKNHRFGPWSRKSGKINEITRGFWSEKSGKSQQIWENWSQQLEHMQVKKRGTELGVCKGKHSLLACHTYSKCSMETSHDSVNVKFDIKVISWGRVWSVWKSLNHYNSSKIKPIIICCGRGTSVVLYCLLCLLMVFRYALYWYCPYGQLVSFRTSMDHLKVTAWLTGIFWEIVLKILHVLRLKKRKFWWFFFSFSVPTPWNHL